jgi:hypothetical protein
MNYQNSKLYPISEAAFTILDYDKDQITAKIAVDGFNGVDNVQLGQDDILEAALAYNVIESFFDPTHEDANFLVEYEPGRTMDFVFWWEGLCPVDAERFIEGAITTKAAMGLERTYRELFQISVAA